MKCVMNDFLKSQLDELRENKLRVVFLAIILFGTIIFAVSESDKGEEINLDESQKISEVAPPVKVATPTSSDKVKAVIGANVDEIFISDPFINPAPKLPAPVEVPVKSEEKIVPPAPIIITPPVEETPKPPEVKFFLRGIAIGENKTAFFEKVDAEKVDKIFVTIGDNLNGKIIVDIMTDCVIFDDGDKMYVEQFAVN